VLDAKSRGERPVKITIDEPASVDPGLLLFAAFATRQLLTTPALRRAVPRRLRRPDRSIRVPPRRAHMLEEEEHGG
jgi:hypothetical protein